MKGQKYLDGWATQDTEYFCLIHFKVFTILLKFNKRET